MARKRNQLKDLERDERKNKSCRGAGRGARESAGKHGAGEKGEERRGLGGKPLHECLRGNCGLESLRGVIAQKHQRLGGSVWWESVSLEPDGMGCSLWLCYLL